VESIPPLNKTVTLFMRAILTTNQLTHTKTLGGIAGLGPPVGHEFKPKTTGHSD
jgi:hypothetical protein